MTKKNNNQNLKQILENLLPEERRYSFSQKIKNNRTCLKTTYIRTSDENKLRYVLKKINNLYLKMKENPTSKDDLTPKVKGKDIYIIDSLTKKEKLEKKEIEEEINKINIKVHEKDKKAIVNKNEADNKSIFFILEDMNVLKSKK